MAESPPVNGPTLEGVKVGGQDHGGEVSDSKRLELQKYAEGLETLNSG